METVRIRDLGWKKVGSGIWDKHPGSATLAFSQSENCHLSVSTVQSTTVLFLIGSGGILAFTNWLLNDWVLGLVSNVRVIDCVRLTAFSSVADPDPGSGIGYLFYPWIRDPGWEKVSIRIRDPG